MKLAFGTPPGWVNTLMATRNAVMGRLGYKAPRIQRGFPVLRTAPGMELSGLDDATLDFRALDARDLVERHRADMTRLITLALVGERDPAPGRPQRFAGFGTLAIELGKAQL